MAEGVVRRLAAILVADAAGYSRLMGQDELATHRQFRADLAELLGPQIARHHGRLIKTTGDGLLAEFGSVVDAVECAAAIQAGMAARGGETAEDRRLAYRIGVHLGDVIVEDGDIYGDDVNVAVRLEQLAEPGGVSVSANVYGNVCRKLKLPFEDFGEHRVKNIAQPIRVYRLKPEPRAPVPGPRRDAAPAAERPAIVVLPFENLSRDPEQDYFCDGLTQDITTDLSKFSDLLVIAANSAFTYKGRKVKIQEVSRDLGVRYVLEGSVQKTEARLRTNAQLIDGESGHHLWAERYDRALADLFQMQDDIIRRIVAALAVKVTALERRRAMRKTVDLTAYELYLKGAHLYSHETEERLGVCAHLFEQATRLDPEFARAWGYLAYVTARAVMQGWRPQADLGDAERYAARAVQLDAQDYANHWDLAFVHQCAGRFDRALAEYEIAYGLNPNDADLMAEMAEALVYCGDAERGIEQIRQAMRLNPYCPDWYRWNLGWACYNARRYREAIDELEPLLDPPNHARLIMAAAHQRLGETDAARRRIEQFLEREPDYRLERLRRRTAFRRPEDERHWLEAVAAAGLPA